MIKDDDILEKFRIFGANVKKCREKADMTIKELSKTTGIREHYLRRIEKGDCKGISISQVYLLADNLNVPPHELCEGI